MREEVFSPGLVPSGHLSPWPSYPPGRCSRSTCAGGAARRWGPLSGTRSRAARHQTGSRICQGDGGEGRQAALGPSCPSTTDIPAPQPGRVLGPSLEGRREHRRRGPGVPDLGKALRLVSKYSLRPFCTMSSSLLQSRRLSSSLWSEHTLITCGARVKDKLRVSVVQLGGSKVGSEKDPHLLSRDSQ